MILKSFIALVLLVIVLVIWMMFRASQNEAQAQQAAPSNGQIITVEGQDVHVEIAGNGPPLLLIHGASGNLRDLTFGLTEALSDTFTTLAVDRPGLGYTPPLDPKGATLIQQANLLAATMEQLGHSRFYVLGQSYGGSVALAMALEHPEKVAGLVLVAAPSNVWDTGLDPLYKINANPMSGPVLRLYVAAFPPLGLVRSSLDGIFRPQPVPAGYGAHVGTGLTLRRVTQRANALQVAALKDQVRAMVPRYAEISIPVEAIHGTADTIVPYTIHSEKLARQIADINVTVLPDIGHMPHHTNLDDVVAATHRLHDKVGLP